MNSFSSSHSGEEIAKSGHACIVSYFSRRRAAWRGENGDSSTARVELRNRDAELARQVEISTSGVSKILSRGLFN